MNLSNTDLINYKERIKFSRDDKVKHQIQINNLISSIQVKIFEHVDTRVLRVLQTGSWKKGTIIKPQNDNPIDVDLVFFLDINREEYDTLHRVNDLLLPILKSIYPTKKDSDFWENPKTAGLEFSDSGLNVDVVPVAKTSDPEYVAQPDKEGNVYFTSPELQLEFITQRKNENLNFTTIVRILKKWRNNQDVKLSSFAIELIISHLDINKGVETGIQEAILRFFTILSKKQFPVMLFKAKYETYNPDGSHVYIADPTYEENNVVRYLSDTEWKLIRVQANAALDTLVLAEGEDYKNATTDLWKEVFGNDFNIEPL